MELDAKDVLVKDFGQPMTKKDWHFFLQDNNEFVRENMPNRRTLFLQEVEKLVNGDRAKDYGDAQENFQRIADLWSAFYGAKFTPKQVAVMLNLLKVSRLANTIDHEDSWKDMAGYATLGGTLK